MANESSSWLNPALLKARSPERLQASVPIRLRTKRAEEVDALLLDFSALGFGVECARQVLIGSEVELLLPQFGWTRGVVQWALANRMGGLFSPALSAEDLSGMQEGRGEG